MNLLKALFPITEDPSHFFDNTLPFFSGHWPELTTPSPILLAQVDDPIAPGQLGHVKFQGSRWRACHQGRMVLVTGQQVQVVGRQRSNILVVEPIHCPLPLAYV
ncbi:MAG: NfeD family protein [Leptolyngbya sp.]|nr:NfeD family protein [Leptolyngbya sp.]